MYIRYQSQIMKGTNPDGSKYADPVAWVAYFHSGEAVHYFPRYSYGSQQSLGCVELPWGPAKKIWPYLTLRDTGYRHGAVAPGDVSTAGPPSAVAWRPGRAITRARRQHAAR